MKDQRPSPESLLSRYREEVTPVTGRLKIYIGMAAGVGKTYAMLSDAITEQRKGIDIVAGYIEPHGRAETEALAKEFESIPFKEVSHEGLQLKEFDLDGAIKRHPKIVLVDELPHTNPKDFRHKKRWQDIEELLSQGIDVYTTVNIQHLESVNDVVSKITGVTVSETIPDSFFVKADAIELVDIPPEELIQRLKEGKVYPLARVDSALTNFFTKGNLIALRELALRQLADRVDAQMVKFREQNLVTDIWAVKQKVLVCIGANRFAKRLVRVAQRITSQLKGELVVATIEGIHAAPPNEIDRQLLNSALRFAEDLGAKTVIRSSADIASEIVKIAVEQNATLIIIGKALRPKWQEFIFNSLASEVIRQSGSIPVQVISVERDKNTDDVYRKKVHSSVGLRFLETFLACIVATVLCLLMFPLFDRSNLIMIYLLNTVWVASRFNYREAILATILSVGAFDYFFVPPYYQFSVADGQYLITFAVMFVIGVLIARLTSRVKIQAQAVSDRERQTALLYELSRGLLETKQLSELKPVIRGRLQSILKRDLALFLVQDETPIVLVMSSSSFETDPSERAVAAWVINNSRPAGAGTDTLSGAKGLYLPLSSKGTTLGALAIYVGNTPVTFDEQILFEACADQLSSAVERFRLEGESTQVKLEVERERLRNTILSGVSHDLRTPLTSIHGAASVLSDTENLDPKVQKELAHSIKEETSRLSRMIRNILDMTKIEQQELKLSVEWNSVEELLGGALTRSEDLLRNHKILVDIPEDLPLLQVDAVLIEQVFVNLLENTARHTPQKTELRITSKADGETLRVYFTDNGPGIAPGTEELIFRKHYRGQISSSGFGLGLAICKAIMITHGGDILARRNEGTGTVFELIFPLSVRQPEVLNE